MITYTKHKEILIKLYIIINLLLFNIIWNCFKKTMVRNFSLNRHFYLPWWIFFSTFRRKGALKMKSKEHSLNEVAFTKDQTGCISVINLRGNKSRTIEGWFWNRYVGIFLAKNERKEEESLFYLKTIYILPMYRSRILNEMLHINV